MPDAIIDAMTDAAKAGQRLRRQRSARRGGGGWRAAFYRPEPEHGPGVVMARPEEVLAAIEAMPPDLDWAEVQDHLVPLFERMRPYPQGTPPRLQVLLTPGVLVGFGIDIGPAFVSVSSEMAEGWGLPAGDIAAQALANLHRRAASIGPTDVFHAPLGHVDSASLQAGQGIGSTLVLAPSELGRIFGRQPRRFIAPMRSVLVGLPIEAERDFVGWVFAEFARNDPNHLYPLAFAFDGASVTVERLEGACCCAAGPAT